MIQLPKAIITTLEYHKVFDYPLTQGEIWQYLINLNPKAKVSFQPENFKKSLNQLKKSKKIFLENNYFFLKNSKKLIKIRRKRRQLSQKKIKIAKKIINIFKKIPGIKAIAITGALAMNNCRDNDDIDLMIITQYQRLWIIRPILLLILQLLGKRRKPNQKQVKDKICLNLFLDETALKLNKKKHNLLTSHEISQAKIIYNHKQTWEKFLQQNIWVLNYLPNAFNLYNFRSMAKKPSQFKLTNQNSALDLLNKLFFKWQYQIMKPKITSEQVSINFAFFHPKKLKV
jgi:hypothetical protein